MSETQKQDGGQSVTLPVDGSRAIKRFRQYASTDIITKRFAEILGERGARSFLSSVVLVVANSERLQECTPLSIVSAALQAATLRLSVDPSVGHAYLVPYGARCTFIPGYKGIYQLAIRTDKYRYINAGSVREGMEVEFDPFTGKPSLKGTPISKKIVGWHASFEMYNGYSKTIYMSLEEIHDHAKRHNPKGYGAEKSIWKTHPEAMEKKTVLRQLLLQWGYLDPSDKAILIGEQDEVIDAQALDIELKAAQEAAEQAPKGSAEEYIDELGYESHTAAKPKTPTVSTPMAEAIVAAGLAQNIHHARGICGKLSIGDPLDETKVRMIRLYNAWRDMGLEGDAAAARALLGEVPD